MAGGTDGDQIFNEYTFISSRPVVSHCLIQGGTDAIQGVLGHKITKESIITASSAAAIFVDVTEGAENLRLKNGSPAIDAGDNDVIDGDDDSWSPDGDDVPYDLDGNERLFGDTVDLGPYEYGASKSPFARFTNIGNRGNDLRFSTPQTHTLKLYPNPARDIVNIVANQGFIYTILNASGVQVRMGSVQVGVNTLDIKALAVGVYLFVFQNEDTTEMHRVIIK